MSKIFLFDVDGVCGDMITPVLTGLTEKFGKAPAYSDIKNHDLLDPNKTSLNVDEVFFVHDMMTAPDFANTLEVIDGCKETIDFLRASGHTVKWLTAPYYWSKTWCHDRLEWLKRNFDATNYDLIYATDKSLVYGDVFVDDKISNIEQWQARWKDKKGFLFTQPWNDKSELPRASWDDIKNLG